MQTDNKKVATCESSEPGVFQFLDGCTLGKNFYMKIAFRKPQSRKRMKSCLAALVLFCQRYSQT